MGSPQYKFKNIYLFILVLAGWFALIAQLYLIIVNRVTAIPETIMRYFSFFTILTNILVAVCCTILLLNKKKSLYNFFSNSKNITAITVYITVVGFVYNLILRFLWKPQGLQLLVDELLHTLIPALFILFWLLFIPKAGLKTKHILPGLIYPLVYVIYILIRGEFTGFYPYPFINVKTIGYNKVFLNSGILVIVFAVFSLLFVVIDKYGKNSDHNLTKSN
ncbi:MAG: Pr6Pr family membrane protein [Ginsengibacter sp.]